MYEKRRRGGIEPLHVSMPRELKSRPSTSPTHPGLLDGKETKNSFGPSQRSSSTCGSHEDSSPSSMCYASLLLLGPMADAWRRFSRGTRELAPENKIAFMSGAGCGLSPAQCPAVASVHSSGFRSVSSKPNHASKGKQSVHVKPARVEITSITLSYPVSRARHWN